MLGLFLLTSSFAQKLTSNGCQIFENLSSLYYCRVLYNFAPTDEPTRMDAKIGFDKCILAERQDQAIAQRLLSFIKLIQALLCFHIYQCCRMLAPTTFSQRSQNLTFRELNSLNLLHYKVIHSGNGDYKGIFFAYYGSCF